MNLRLRLILSFIGIASLVFIVGIVGIVTANQIANSADVIVNSTSPSLTALSQIEAAGNNMRETAIHHAMFRRIGADSIEDQEYAEAKAELEKWLAELKSVTNDQVSYESLAATIPEYVARTQALIDTANNNTDDKTLYEATEGIEDAESAFSDAVDAAITKESTEFQLNI